MQTFYRLVLQEYLVNSCFKHILRKRLFTSTHSMSEDIIEICESFTAPIYKPSEFLDFPQTLVTEKIIFCLDGMLFSNEDESFIHNLFYLLKSYLQLKKKICIKPPEFEFLVVYSNGNVTHSFINSTRDLQLAILSIKSCDKDEESESLNLEDIFNKLVEIVELPDPECCKKGLPPPYAYHILWLFNQNIHVPVLENTNSFDFLMLTPYVALDILYFYDNSIKDNECNKISSTLLELNKNGMGYFLPVNIKTKSKYFAAFAQALGHPLIRMPQSKSKYKITDIGPEPEISIQIKNNEVVSA